MDGLFSWMERESGDVRKSLSLHAQGLSAFLRQHVSIFVLNQSVEVQTRDALTNTGLTYAQGHITFNALPEVAFERSETNVLLLFALVLLDDVQDHEVVLVHGVENRAT